MCDERESEETERAWCLVKEELVLAREGVGLRSYRKLYLWRRCLRLKDSEDVSKRLSKEQVVCSEAKLDGGRR